MKIWHRGHIGPEYKDLLDKNKVQSKPWYRASDSTKIKSYMFVVDESNPTWNELKTLLKGEHTYISTEFSQKEIAKAEWSIAHAQHSIDNLRCGNFAWSEEYISDLCKNCGTGWRQIAPFRIKSEPKLGKKVFADFGSAFELFSAPVVLETLQRHGIGGFKAWPLILNKGGQPAESLKQLLVTELTQPAIEEELVEHERYSQTDCPVCGRTWHAHYTRGMLPVKRVALNPKVDFQLTSEWFGNGRTARREILLSRRVVNLALENNWQGIQFIPVNVV